MLSYVIFKVHLDLTRTDLSEPSPNPLHGTKSNGRRTLPTLAFPSFFGRESQEPTLHYTFFYGLDNQDFTLLCAFFYNPETRDPCGVMGTPNDR